MNKSKLLSILLVALLCVIPFSAEGATVSSISHAMDVVSTGLNQAIHVIKGPDGKLYISAYGGGNITRVGRDGQNKETFVSSLNQPIGMYFDESGNLYVAEHAGSKVDKIEPNGTKTVIKEGTGILTGLVIDSSDKLYTAEYGTGKILKMNLDGSSSVEFVTGLGTNTIIGMTIDSNDNIYVSDRSGGKIRKIAPDNTVTDFITGLSTPTWVTFGDDGYLYVSLGSRRIEKYDISGNKVGEFLTPTTLGYPWGTYIDETGCIYFQTMGSGNYKIIGDANTNNKKLITLNFNTTLSEMQLDHSAFIISGAAINPTVTQAVSYGSGVHLTLDNDISYTDSNLKVSYIKTGIKNMSTSGSAIELDNFTNLPVKNNVLRVTGVSSVLNINVNYGTNMNAVKAQFPAILNITLSNMTTTSAAIAWDNGTPVYNGNITGNYLFKGTISTSENVSNSSNLVASVTVIVSQEVLSHDATLSGIGLSSGTLTPEFSSGTTSYSTSFPNNVTSLRVRPTLSDNDAQVSVNGTPVVSGEESTPISLNVGSNEINVEVTAEDGVTIKTYTINVQRQSQSSDGDKPVKPKPSEGSVVVIINGQEQNAGKETKTTVGGQTVVTVEVDNKIIKSKIESAIENNTQGSTNVLQVPITNQSADVVKVQLTGDIVKKLEANAFNVTIKRNNIEYVIPAEELTISKLAESLYVLDKDLQDIKIEVQITNLPQRVVNQYTEIAKENGAELVFPPVAFEVVAKTIQSDGKIGEVAINKFSNFVERVMELPSGVDPSKVTTGIVFNSDGTYNHVPTEVFQKEGKWYARLSSLTNSSYSLIWNPLTVKSVEKHWSKNAVYDMASRLVIFNPETFEPDNNITRAEFSEYIVRALGLYREGSKHENIFKDVSANGDRTLAILIANEYGIVTGYQDGTFRPDALITREEAMTMYQRAMNVTKLVGTDPNRYQSYTDYNQVSSWAASYVKEVLSANVFSGKTATTISPKSNLTYAEAAQAIKNLLVESKLINK